jgi:hypothetical protein
MNPMTWSRLPIGMLFLLLPTIALGEPPTGEAPAPAHLVLSPTADHLLMWIVDPADTLLTEAPATCRYAVTQGGEVAEHQVAFESGWDAVDLGAICWVSLSMVAPQVTWPPEQSLTIAAELRVGGASVLSNTVTVEPGTPFSSREAMLTAIRGAGFEVVMGEASQEFADTYYFDLTATRDGTMTYIGVQEGTLAAAGPTDCLCPAPTDDGFPACAVCATNHRVHIEGDNGTVVQALGRLISGAFAGPGPEAAGP